MYSADYMQGSYFQIFTCYGNIIVFLIIFTESHPNNFKIWQEVQVHYLLSVLEAACNDILDTEKCKSDMSEKELSDLLVVGFFRKEEQDVGYSFAFIADAIKSSL